MKKLMPFLFTLCFVEAQSQNHYLDSLERQLRNNQREDTSRVWALFSLSDYYGFIQFDSCLIYAEKTFALSRKLNYTYGKFLGDLATFHRLNSQGNYAEALKITLDMQRAGEAIKKERPSVMSSAYYCLGLLNREMSNYNEAASLFKKSIEWQKGTNGPPEDVSWSYSQMGIVCLLLNHLDSALYYAKEGYDLALRSRKWQAYLPLSMGALGNVNFALGRFGAAEKYYKEAVNQSALSNNAYFQARNYNNLATLFEKTNHKDSSIQSAATSLQLSRQHNFGEFTLDASRILARIYDSENQSDSTVKYMKIMVAARDSIFSISKGAQFQRFAFSEIQRLEKINSEKEASQTRTRMYILASALGFVLLLAFVFYRNSVRRKADKLKIEHAYDELKSTQAQLIQSEKMASLGELTAGIAHEIQNPLNFVNNFSEVNKELLTEMSDEISKGNYSEVKALAQDVINNEEKVSEHGKRADAIVKGMLQHSRTSAGQKELTDINTMCDEYLRLAYHGLRAKDKTFSAKFETDFDTSIGKVNVVPQDIARVLLNLINNAFYAVTEKKQQSDGNYEPCVSIKTTKLPGKIEIVVQDNGNGIPENLKDKIFQPFFTTKPAGQGTGLGLSLAYDTIKAHGGEIKVQTKEGDGSEFIVQLSVNA